MAPRNLVVVRQGAGMDLPLTLRLSRKKWQQQQQGSRTTRMTRCMPPMSRISQYRMTPYEDQSGLVYYEQGLFFSVVGILSAFGPFSDIFGTTEQL